MSLINQMLKDLETRQAGVTSGAGVVADLGAVDAPLPSERRGHARYLAPLMIGASALVVVYAAPLREQLDASYETVASGIAVLLASAGRTDLKPPRPDIPVAAERRVVERSRNRRQDMAHDARAAAEVTHAPRVATLTPATETVAESTTSATIEGKLALPWSAAPMRPILTTPDPQRLGLRLSERIAMPHAPVLQSPPSVERHALAADSEVATMIASGDAQPAPLAKPHRALPGDHLSVEVKQRPAGQSVRKRAVPPTSRERAESVYHEGVALLRRGQQEAGDARLADAVRLAPNETAARELLAARMIDSGRPAAAESLLREGLDGGSPAPRLIKMYARLLVDRGDVAGALKALDRVLPRSGGRAEYLAFRGALLQRLGRYAEAVRNYRAAIAVAPGHGAWWLGYGLSLESVGKRADALRAYRRAGANAGLAPAVRRFIDRKLSALSE